MVRGVADAVANVATAGGFCALVLLTLAAAVGVVMQAGQPPLLLPKKFRLSPKLAQVQLSSLHRNISLTSTAFVALHVGALMVAGTGGLHVRNALIPLLDTLKPWWLTLGTVSLDLLLAVLAASLLGNTLSPRGVKVLRWLSYAMWPVALAHAIGGGTDVTSAWFEVFAIVSLVTVGVAVLWRVATGYIEPVNRKPHVPHEPIQESAGDRYTSESCQAELSAANLPPSEMSSSGVPSSTIFPS